MAYSLVGTIGAAASGASGASVTPAWGASENRTAGNLLICWVASNGAAGTIATPTGWSADLAPGGANGVSLAIFHRIATGADAAPTVTAVTGSVLTAQLAEFAGDTPTGVVKTTTSNTATTTSPVLATLGGSSDLRPGNLVCFAAAQQLSAAGTTTLTHTLNNGVVGTATNNSASSIVGHYSFGYGTTTGNAANDNDSLAFTTTTSTGAIVGIASYNLPNPLRLMLGAGM